MNGLLVTDSILTDFLWFQWQTPSNQHNPPQVSTIYANSKIQNVVAKKNIKQKKRHEIEKMSQVTARVAQDLGIEYIIDFGSGLGHLSRMLAYGYDLNVCCLEQQETLSQQAMWAALTIQ